MDPMTMMALGSAAGGLLGGLGGSKQAGVTTTTTDIPEWLRPFAMNLMNQAQPAFNQSVAGGQNPVLGASQDQMMQTIGGAYLDPRSNPWLQETFEQGAKQIRGALSPQFGHMQAFGGNSGFNQALGRSLGDFATDLYGGNYSQERDRQFNATMGGPGFASGQAEGAFAPFNQYAGLLKGWGSQQSQPFYENKGANILGGALVGGSLARAFK